MNTTRRKTTAAMILGGGLAFAGSASAGVVLFEDFEGASPGAWSNGFGTYATGANYSGDPHSSVPSGGAFYGHLIGIGSDPGVFTSNFNTSQIIDFAGADATLIAGGAFLNFDGWMASWTSDSDYAAFSLEFFDAAGGTGNSLGIADIADGSVDDGQVVSTPAGAWNDDNWSNYLTHVAIPTSAASMVFRYEGRAISSNGNDAYVDNISLSVDAASSGLFVPLSTAPVFITANFTGGAGGNNNASDDANWDNGPSFPWDSDTTVVIANGTTGGNPAVIDAALGSQNVRQFVFGEDGVTTDIVMATGSELIGSGPSNGIIGLENSTVNLTLNGTAILNHTGDAEEGSELNIGEVGSTVDITMNGDSVISSGNFVADSSYAIGYRRPLTTDPDPRLGDDIDLGNGGDVTLTMNNNAHMHSVDVFHPNDSGGGSLTVVQNDDSVVSVAWDTRFFDTAAVDDPLTTEVDESLTTTRSINWTLNDNSQFTVARDHGLGEAAGAGSIVININDNALFYAAGRIAMGAGFVGSVEINQAGGRLQAGSAIGSPGAGGEQLTINTGPDATDLVRDGVLWMGEGASSVVYNLSGGNADITRTAFVGADGAATVNQSGGTFTIYGTGAVGDVDGNDTVGIPITTWTDGGGDLFIARIEGDTGNYNLSGGTLSVARNVFMGFDSSDGTVVGGTGSLMVSGTGDLDVTGGAGVGGDGHGTLSVRGGAASVDLGVLAVGGIAGTESGSGTIEALLTGSTHTSIDVSGATLLQNNANLNVELDVLTGTFRPTAGQSFVLINHTSLGGDAGVFASVTGSDVDGIDWTVSYSASQISVMAATVYGTADADRDGDVDNDDLNIVNAALGNAGDWGDGDFNNDGIIDSIDLGIINAILGVLPGDYNSDGQVTAADYTVWADTFGSTTDLRADGNGDGSITAADYTIWADNFGAGAPGAAVPEPTSLALLAMGGLMLGRRRRRA